MSLSGEAGERRVEIVDGEGDVPVAGAELVAAFRRLEVVGQLELGPVLPGTPRK